MKEHFAQTLNETRHLEYMESRGGNYYWIDRFFARHLVLAYYWINVVYYWLDPKSAYHLSYEIEIHAAETYAEYLALHNGPDEKILEILNDELHHSKELHDAMEMINVTKKWIWRGEEVDPPNHITKEEVQEMIDEVC